MSHLEQSLLELVQRAASELSQDVLTAVERARKNEDPDSNARVALEYVRESLVLAADPPRPISPDPVATHFYVVAPPGYDTLAFEEAARAAMTEATRAGYLESGLVDPVTGKPVRSGVGTGNPAVHFQLEDRKTVEVRVLLDTGVEPGPGAHYILPDESITASRNLAGVRRAALDALIQSQGSGTGPGVLAVGIGGDRTSGAALAHQQFLRPLNERSRTKALADLEARILEDANNLGIGPMGFGGKTALLAVKVGAQLSAGSNYHVSVCYLGWNCRRQGVELDAKGGIKDWLYGSGATLPADKSKKAPKKEAAPAKEEAPSESETKKTAKKATKKAAKKTAKKVTKKTKSK